MGIRIGFKIIFVIIFSVFFIISCSDYGESISFDDDQIYYISENIDEKRVNELGEYLKESGFFKGNGVHIQLDKPEETYIIKFVVNESVVENEEIMQKFTEMEKNLTKQVFNNSPIEVHLCNTDFKRTYTVIE
jgi:hypothetical protein